MGLYKRDGTQFYWMSFRINGRKYSESTKTMNKRLAERIYFKKVTDIAEGRWFPNEAKKRTFEDLRERYMRDHSSVHKTKTSQARDHYTFRQLVKTFGGLTLAEITPAKISDHKSKRQQDGVKPNTIAKEFEMFKNALSVAVNEWEWMERNPFEKVKIIRTYDKKERWLTPEEEDRLLDASQPWLKEIIVFTLNTGFRRGEVLSLNWSQINLSRRSITLMVTKNKQKRTVPINEGVLNLLREKSKVRHISGSVFTSSVGTARMNCNLERAFRAARKKADLMEVRFHDLRHTFATRLVQAGVDLYVVKELLGHKSLSMTMRYAHHYPESLRHGVEVLDSRGYILATVEENRKNPSACMLPQLFDAKRKKMVGDVGFEPTASAV